MASVPTTPVSMYLLDTDSLSALHRGHAEIAKHVAHADQPVATTIISRIETLRGRIEFLRKAATGDEVLRAQQWLNQSESLLALIEIVPFNTAAARIFDGLRDIPRLRKSGHEDLLIASIALAQRATLITRNLKDFQTIPQLKVENWVR